MAAAWRLPIAWGKGLLSIPHWVPWAAGENLSQGRGTEAVTEIH